MSRNRTPHQSGERFGRLVIQKQVESRQYKHGLRRMYECKCDCGTIRVFEETNLRLPTRRSCGCYRKELTSKKPGEATYNRQYREYRRSAKKRDREFILTIDEFI